ncbi:hypothetical protein [Streptomyces sp. NK15101]|uniref:hypothetical protein n=1 Tax=Streptomyces sp. NK15101 TaxID=2873261 RepID=UPI001CED68A1|nr:hypothetical protein [Streptomyces sp. NK15101]
MWNTERGMEWQKSEYGVSMTKRALDYYKKFFPGPSHDAFIAMIRTALTGKYADMAGVPKSALAAAGHKLVSGLGGGLLGGSAEKATGVNPYKEILGIASTAFRDMEKAALTQGQDDQRQMYQELHDNR